MDPLTLAATIASARRWGPKLAVGLLVAIAVWFAIQSWRANSANDVLRGQVASETTRANEAVADLAAAKAEIQRGNAATTADAARVKDLEVAVQKQKDQVDALQARYGATRVSDLTRAHLARLRDLQAAAAGRP